MKVLLLDRETVGIVSMVISQKEIIDRGVYLVQKLEKTGDNAEEMKHVTAMCLLRPTAENIELLRGELGSPRFKEYHLIFTNMLKQNYIEQLASADAKEVVKSVQEYFADYYAVNRDLFSLNLPDLGALHRAEGQAVRARIVDGVVAALLSLKRKPVIKYLRNSDLCREVAEQVAHKIDTENALFDWRRPDVPPLLLLLDRREDPITPLLTPWSFQSMVHEELTLVNNRVDMKGRANVPADMREIPLSSEQDEFYRANMFENFDVFAANIKERVDAFSARKDNVRKVSSIQEMQAFLEKYPEFKREEVGVMKHFTLIPELSKIVGDTELLRVSEVEQTLACEDSQAAVTKEILSLLESPRVRMSNKLRLVLLYHLRYEKSPQSSVQQFVDVLSRQDGWTQDMAALIPAITRYAGQERREEDIFLNKTMASAAKRIFTKGFIPQSIDNAYTRHTPFLATILDNAANNKLNPKIYETQQGSAQPSAAKPQDIIVFILGGATFAEAKAVAAINAKQGAAYRVVLGGTTIHNSKSFLDMISSIEGRSSAAGPSSASIKVYN
jgi:vacuolar protein sorting-associated protein 45